MKRRLFLSSVLVIALLVGGCGLWVWQAKRQYALNRQLIAALLGADTKHALALVNAGADPNTRLEPPPTPTLPDVLRAFVHPKPLPDKDSSPTAFLLVCGAAWGNTHSTTIGLQGYNHSSSELAQSMLLHHANLNARATGMTAEMTPLTCALLTDRESIAKLLLTWGADINAPDTHGRTALHRLAQAGAEDSVQWLLAHGAAVNSEDYQGDTALHFSLRGWRNFSVIHQLVMRGANPNRANKKGMTPLMYAQRQHRPDLVALLHKGAK